MRTAAASARQIDDEWYEATSPLIPKGKFSLCRKKVAKCTAKLLVRGSKTDSEKQLDVDGGNNKVL